MRKIWEKPKLIVLVRGRPEEMVLAACKYTNIKGASQNRNNRCTRAVFKCANCDQLAPS